MASVESRPSRAVVTARSSTHGTRSRAVKQVQQSCSLRQLCIEMANLPRSSRFRCASSLSCTRCWPWQATVLKVISALGLELHITAARCQLRRRARRWLSSQPPTRVDRPQYTLCYAIPVVVAQALAGAATAAHTPKGLLGHAHRGRSRRSMSCMGMAPSSTSLPSTVRRCPSARARTSKPCSSGRVGLES
jgi:hypothetical protein